MTNEELVIKIQAGETELTCELWHQVERFVMKQASRFFYTYQLRCEQFGLTIEDLYQEGYFAINKSIEMFKTKKECKFLTYAGYQLKKIFFKVTKMNYIGWQNNTINRATSINEPVGDNETTLLDILVSPSTEIDKVVEKDFNEQLSKDLNNIIGELTERQAYVIIQRFYMNVKPVDIGRQLSVHKTTINSTYQTAINNMSQHKELLPYLADLAC